MDQPLSQSTVAIGDSSVGNEGHSRRIRLTLLASTALAGAAFFGSAADALANNECGNVGAGNPYTIACGTGPFTKGVTYSSANTAPADSNIFAFTNSQITNTTAIVFPPAALGGTGVSLSSNEKNHYIYVDINQISPGALSIAGGEGLNLNQTAFEVKTQGEASPVHFNMDGGSITGGKNILGVAHGVSIETTGINSDVDFHLKNGVITGGTALSADGVNIKTTNAGSHINFATDAGTKISANSGNGVVLSVKDASSINAAVNGEITSTRTLAGVGVGTGLHASATDGDVDLNVGGSGVVNGSAIGLRGETSGKGNVKIDVSGAVNQTSASALSSVALGSPIGVAGVATGSGDVQITTNAGSSVKAIGANPLFGGIGVYGEANTGATTVLTSGDVEANGVGVAGVSNKGNATVTVGGNVTVTGTGSTALNILGTTGVFASSQQGSATANVSGGNIGSATAGTSPDFGVVALVTAGDKDATINVGDGAAPASTVYGNFAGLYAQNFSKGRAVVNSSVKDPNGNQSVVNSDDIGVFGGAGEGGVLIDTGPVNAKGAGVVAVSVGGNAEVLVNGKISAGGAGVSVTTTNGNSKIVQNATVDSGKTGLNVLNIGKGNVDVTVAANAPIRADVAGVNVTKAGDGATTINVASAISGLTTDETVDGVTVASVGATSGASAISVNTSKGGTIRASNNGVNVSAVGAGSTAVVVGDTITAGNNGVNIVSGFGAAQSDAIVSVETAADINAGNHGVNILSGVDVGDVNVKVGESANSTVTSAKANGVNVVKLAGSGNANIQVGAGGAVLADEGSAVSVINANIPSATSGNVLVNNAGTLRGKGGLTSTIAIGATNSAVVENKGVVTTATGSPSGRIVGIVAGNDAIVNNRSGGAMTGTMDVAAINTVTLNNWGTWNTSGVSTFASVTDPTYNNFGTTNATGATTIVMVGAQNIVNNTGTFNSNGVTTFAMASPSNNVNNSGTFNVNGQLYFMGVTSPNVTNSGMVDMRNGHLNDYTYTNGSFNGVGAGAIGVDAQLGAYGSAADRLGVQQNVTGSTAIAVRDMGGPSGYNPFGVAVVGIGGKGGSGNFYLSSQSSYYSPLYGGVLNKGLFSYYLGDSLVSTGCGDSLLVGKPTNCVALMSAPNATAHQLPAATTGAQSLWYDTTLLWEDRQSEIRSLLLGNRPVSQPVVTKGPAPVVERPTTYNVWAKGMGSWTNRTSYWNDGRRFGFDLGYNQNSFGFVAGADMAVRGLLNPADTLVFGPLGGYTESNLNFRSEGNNFRYQGGTVGGYASYLSHGFFVDGLIKADILNLNMNLPTLANVGFANGSVAATTWGLLGNAGYRWDVGQFFLEPILTIAYAQTKVDNLNLPSMVSNVVFATGESVRGAAGGRVGASMDNLWAGKRVDVAFTGRVWDEWGNGANTATIDNPGVPVFVADRLTRVYGEVKGGVDLIALGGGFGGFVNGGLRWNNQFSTTFIKGGVGYSW